MTSSGSDRFELRGPNAQAVGWPVESGFVVQAGATARKSISPSGLKQVTSLRRPLLAEGLLADEGATLRFTRDHLFKTPSGAAGAVLGRTANGWIEWKREDGVTLKEATAAKPTSPELDEIKVRQIREKYTELSREGRLPSKAELDRQYDLFRERFGPRVLAGLDGEHLLNLMHDGGRDSLTYWLEFKSDGEFAARQFGGIAGGAATKFGVFRRKETGVWQALAGGPGQIKDISVEEAVEIARKHRDQLLAGVELLEAVSDQASDEEYAELQQQLDELAPDVSALGWGHKYLSLLFPGKLDDFHSPSLQRFHLIKLLQVPPEGDGRYDCAGRFIRAAASLELPMWHFTNVLNALHGSQHRYWRIGTRGGPSDESQWSMMRDRSCIAIGWVMLEDLSWVQANRDSRVRLKELLEELDPKNPSTIGNDASQLINFIANVKEGDVVVAADGMKILGVGRVRGGYEYHTGFDFKHQRKVKWLDKEQWQLPFPDEGLRSTVRELKKHPENLIAIERRLQLNKDEPIIKPPVVTTLSGTPGRIQSVLERKGQVILYGPPGVGKTYWAELAARDLAAISAFGKAFEDLDDRDRREVLGAGESSTGLVRMCCFHPAYGYEDFIEGYRPSTVNGQMTFELRDGVFKKLCSDAALQPERDFYLIVDEINRGDIPRIFGELLMTLEKDKRGKKVILPVSGEPFSVPPNVFLIGTMNTADRSISLLDAALRRRFGFVELMPDGTTLKGAVVDGIPLQAWFEALNSKIREHVGRDARNLQVGHSYFLSGGTPVRDFAALKRVIRDDLLPLLEEYCYEDFETLAAILGKDLVDTAKQCLKQELFESGRESDLVQALLASFPDLERTTEAVTAAAELEAQAESDDAEADEIDAGEGATS